VEISAALYGIGGTLCTVAFNLMENSNSGSLTKTHETPKTGSDLSVAVPKTKMNMVSPLTHHPKNLSL
jgi:hypothetical protein